MLIAIHQQMAHGGRPFGVPALRLSAWGAPLTPFGLWAALWLSSCLFAHAHDPGLSTATLRREGERLNVLLTFAPTDVEALVPIDAGLTGQRTRSDFDAVRLPLETLAGDVLEVRWDGHPVPATDAAVKRDSKNNVHIQLIFPLHVPARLTVRSTFLRHLPLGHRQYLSLRDEHGSVLGEGLLDAKNNVFETTFTESNQSRPRLQSFQQFLLLGLQHIATGYDHLLFLLALLIAGGSFLSAGKIITSFTLAHSLTLALATLHLIQLPAGLVEPLIAVSIMYVGIENILRRNLERRWRLTFAFGLVHGLGFASVLCELGVGVNGGGIAVPLVSFTLGVEAGQVAIAAVALPLIWKLKQNPSFAARCTPVCSVMVTVAGTYWLIERTLLH